MTRRRAVPSSGEPPTHCEGDALSLPVTVAEPGKGPLCSSARGRWVLTATGLARRLVGARARLAPRGRRPPQAPPARTAPRRRLLRSPRPLDAIERPAALVVDRGARPRASFGHRD